MRSRLALLARITVLPLATVCLAAGCSGGSSGGTQQSTAALLAKAKTAMDQATSVHFVLTSSGVPGGGVGARVVGGDGVAVRPRSFQGTLKIMLGSATASLEVISVAGKVYIKPPFTTKFAVTDPAIFHLKDPGMLVDQQTGLSRLLTSMTGAQSLGKSRINGEVVEQIKGTVPGSVVGNLFTTADPTKPVTITVALADTSGQLRRAILSGPFYRMNTTSTFTVVFDRYGQKVTVVAPHVG